MPGTLTRGGGSSHNATLQSGTISNTEVIDMYTAPKDARSIILPGGFVGEEVAPLSFSTRQETVVNKNVYVEEGRRKIPRPGYEDRVKTRSDKLTLLEQRRAEEALRNAQSKPWTGVDIHDSSLFEEDLNYVEPKPEFPGPYDPERARILYTNACKMLKIVPSSRFLRGLQKGRVIAGYQGMGELGARAVAISLVTSLIVTELHIPGNKLGPEGMMCMAKLIHGNEVIKVLDISDNDLGRQGAKILCECIIENESIQQFNAAGNKFDDETGPYFEQALKINKMIRQLDLSRNQFSVKGAICIAKGLEENTCVTILDLSYNHIRWKGVRGLARMLGHNNNLLILDLSWNGLDTECAKLIGDGLNNNTALTVLNATGCRLNAEGIIKMLGAMKDNQTLKTLQIKHNPITNADLILLLRALDTLPECAISYIDAGSVTVSSQLLELVNQMKLTRPGFYVSYRGLLSIRDLSRNMLQTLDLTGGDPLEAIIKYTRTKNLRLVDLFARIDTDKSGSITRQELISGVADAGIPLSIKQMDRLVAKLDADGDGEIDFSELLNGYKQFIRKLHREGRVARKVFKLDDENFPGLGKDGGAESAANKKAEHAAAKGGQKKEKDQIPHKSKSDTVVEMEEVTSEEVHTSSSAPDLALVEDVSRTAEEGSELETEDEAEGPAGQLEMERELRELEAQLEPFD